MRVVYDMIVIGGGPAGSTVANFVAEKGYNVLIVEKSRFPGEDNVCGGALSIKAFRESGADDNISEKWIFKGTHFFPWGEYHRGMKNVSFRREVFDNFLAEKAVESGAKLKTSTKVFDVKIGNGKSNVFLKDVNSGKESFESGITTVFADGPKTLAARKFPNLGFHSKPHNTALGMVYELEWKDNPLTDSEYYHGADFTWRGYGWIFPKKDLINVGVCAPLSALNKERKNIRSILDYFVYKHPISSKKLRGRRVLSLAAALIPLAPARKICAPSILVVGDAAGMVNPTWMGGLEYCIFAGKTAGRIIVKALEQQDYSEKFLSRYQISWENSEYFARIRKALLISRILTPFTRIDKSLPAKYTALSFLQGRREIRKCLGSLLYQMKI
jgi:geranylgeranyl reductase family protein